MTTGRSEDYLEAIQAIQERRDKARVKDVAEALGVGISSVTEMMQRLGDAGYIEYEKYGGARLTKKGADIAERTRRKHEILKDFLIALGVDEGTAESDACKMEHILDPKTIERVDVFLKTL